jgi:hypothetical protein
MGMLAFKQDPSIDAAIDPIDRAGSSLDSL